MRPWNTDKQREQSVQLHILSAGKATEGDMTAKFWAEMKNIWGPHDKSK